MVEKLDDFLVVDFETTGLNYYAPNFHVVSASFTRSRDGASRFIQGEKEVGDFLKALKNRSLVAYNLAFEQGVVRCVYPDLTLNWYCDVQRLVQLYDNGGTGRYQGFGLKNAIRRILRDESNYEEIAYKWIRDNIPEARKGREGKYISCLPHDLLADYNIKDTEYTLELYKKITKEFEKQKYDWLVDHDLYLTTVKLIVDAKIRGVKVDRERLKTSLADMVSELTEIDEKFHSLFAEQIGLVREKLKVKAQAKFKKKIVTELPAFNITSKDHLKMLFIENLNLKVTFTTPSGKPSFKAPHMHLYGDGGKLLAKRGKLLNWINQVIALEQLSEADGRWHLSLKAVGTSTGRLAGGN